MRRKCSALLLTGLLLTLGLAGSAHADGTDNFVITNYDVKLDLGRDADGRSTLRAVETITADFPMADENHGLERIVVKSYDSHSTSFKLESVTDESGRTLPYHWEGDALRIGDKETYAHGLKTYRITYTQRDVTRHYKDTGKDEFYWDVIGIEWRVPIEQATVNLAVAPELRDDVQTDLQCYTGTYRSTDRCQVNGGEGNYRVEARDIGNRSGITVAIGFKKGTFAEYEKSLVERLVEYWLALTAVTTVIGIGVIIWLAVKAHRMKYRESELGTIVPEYLPPKDTSVAAAAAVSPGTRATPGAELTDLAVRHYIRIYETRIKRVFFQGEYEIEVVKDISELREEEKEILSDMFGFVPSVGDRLALKDLKNNSSAYARFLDNDKKLKDLLRSKYALNHIDQSKRDWFSRRAKVLLVLAIFTLSPALLVAVIVAVVFSRTLWVLSDEGLRLRRYLKGLKMYIGVAEAERLKMLQSPEGAMKVGVKDPTSAAQLVKLYERVLPYAVLFGQEKEWSKRLGEYYASTNSQPDWYSGRGAFNAYAFSSAMSSFSSAATTASASSSSSGGSGGGGFSGGGGGGGGGGGW